MSKKILSLALAVVMLVSVFTIAASATTFPAAGQIGYRLVSDAYVGMPAGETVTVKAYYIFPDGQDFDTFRLGTSNLTICWNADYFSYNEDRTWGESFDFFKEGANVNIAASYYTTVAKKFNDNDKAKGYTAAMNVQQTFDTSNAYGYTATTGYAIHNPYGEIFTITFTTEDELTADAVIGIPEGCVGTQIAPQVKKADTVTTATGKYSAANVIKDEFVEGAATLNVSDVSAFLLRNNADDANALDVGVRATFMDAAFPVTFTGAVCNELDNIGIEARVNGEVKARESAALNYIYRNATDDGYDFVGAVTGVDDLDAKIEIRAYFIADGTTYYSNWVAVCANLRYDDAVSNGMSAIA